MNGQLLQHLGALGVQPHWTVHLFLPIAGNREPDMYAVADWLRKQFPSIRLVLPKTERGSDGLSHIVWDGDTTFTPNDWGIPEPDTGTDIHPVDIDAVFVPLLVFDKRGHRVGYGKGFYDRFLAECRPATRKIGVSLFEAVEPISDVTAHDVALDACITPTRIWLFTP